MARDVRMTGFLEKRGVEDALALLFANARPLHGETVHVTQAAGRVAASDLFAAAPVPHFVRSAMDGYAVRAADLADASEATPTVLFVVGETRAGSAEGRPIQSGEAVRITTGAKAPPGATCVLMAEKAEERPLSESLTPPPPDATALVRTTHSLAPGKHLGSIGEDVPLGARIVAAGRHLRPQDAGVLASAGVAYVPVVRRPRVRVLITGDELLPPGDLPYGSKIVDANSLVLQALAARDGAEYTSIHRVKDSREQTRQALLSSDEEVLLVSGGSSVGPEDHAPLVLAEVGEVAVHGVRLRPASPTGFGFLRSSGQLQFVFLLPGNPVSCLCAYEFFAGPLIRTLGGRPRTWPHRTLVATVAERIVSQKGRTDYTRVKVSGNTVTPLMTSGASILSSTTLADGFVIVGEETASLEIGETVTVFLYDGN